MKIFGLMAVRNEADIIEINLRHHLALGVDRFLVVDNGSSDGTDHILAALARELPIAWCRRIGAFLQPELTTELAGEAYLQGADWVVPIDADEFWHTPGRSLREILAESSAGAIAVDVVNFIQSREQRFSGRQALLTMTRRPPRPCGPISEIERLVTSRQIGFVEIEYPPKHLARASPGIRIGQGNHSIHFSAGETEWSDAIVCLHAPLRSLQQLETKIDRHRPEAELHDYLKLSWHTRRWRRLADEERLDEEWAANSYEDDVLDLPGKKRLTVFDTTLRDLVAPWIDQTKFAPRAAPIPPNLDLERALPAEFLSATLARVAAIEGWLEEPQAAMLMATTVMAVLELPQAAIVEIGSYCGQSTVAIGSAASAVSSSAKVYAIDPHGGFVGAADTPDGVYATHPTLEIFRRNISEAGLENVVEPIVKHSFEVKWTEPIGMLFIDGLHDYENVSRDYAAFERFVQPGGYVLFDDCEPGFPGVVRFVGEQTASGKLQSVTRSGKIMVTRKPAHATVSEAKEIS
ncbi:MAG TPA: class I SAM-dependent methyltransferase [Thermoanaerobaculia bacterium]|nr:class I SAM-dependent methyltransferase [Thermoanaerobaculia bacterium]